MSKKEKRYRVWDIEDNKERVLEHCITHLEVGTERRVTVRKNGINEPHTFRILEELDNN